MVFWKYYGGGLWGICRTTSWRGLYGAHKSTTQHWNKPCGSGYYSTKGVGEIKHNGHWVKGILWSGSHYF
jgi:hypothetical protein